MVKLKLPCVGVPHQKGVPHGVLDVDLGNEERGKKAVIVGSSIHISRSETHLAFRAERRTACRGTRPHARKTLAGSTFTAFRTDAIAARLHMDRLTKIIPAGSHHVR